MQTQNNAKSPQSHIKSSLSLPSPNPHPEKSTLSSLVKQRKIHYIVPFKAITYRILCFFNGKTE
nr:MAG TPA: hypothetical protein [Caudoviricetes sp.]